MRTLFLQIDFFYFLLLHWFRRINEGRKEVALVLDVLKFLNFIVQSPGRKFYGGIEIPVKKGRSLHLAINNVAIEASPAEEQVRILTFGHVQNFIE